MSNSSDFIIRDGTLALYIGSGEDVEIPEGVTKIALRAFEGNKSVKYVTLPATVESVGNQSFRGCTSLSAVNILGDLEIIDSCAFAGCSNLEKINIPASICEVNSESFLGCTKLLSSGPFITVGNVLISYTGDEKIVRVPQGIVYICGHAFNLKGTFRNETVIEVILPESLRAIGNKAFFMCKSLSKVQIPASVSYIGDSAFLGCYKIKEILAGNAKVLGDKAFSLCYDLLHVELSDDLSEIGSETFYGCRSLKKIKLPKNLKIIAGGDSGAFEDCKQLVSVVIPEGTTEIGNRAFRGCENLKKIVLPSTLTLIGDQAFENCEQLVSVVLPDGIEEIGKNIFYRTSSLKKIVIPESHTGLHSKDDLADLGIGDENGCIIRDGVLEAYTGAPGIVKVTEGVTKITSGAFSHLFHRWASEVPTPTTKIILPDSVEMFEESHLGYSDKMPAINIPKGYLQQTGKLPAKFTCSLLLGPWKENATAKDWASLYLFQSNKDLESLSGSMLAKIPSKGAAAFLEILKGKRSSRHHIKVAEFFFENKDKISQELIDEFYNTAVSAKANKAADLIKRYATVVDESPTKKFSHPIEAYCSEHYAEHYLNKSLAKARINNTQLKQVKYKDSTQYAPAFVIKCALVPYLDLMPDTSAFKYYRNHKTDFIKISIRDDADKIASAFDRESFLNMLEGIVDITDSALPQRLIPLCRFGTQEHIKSLVSAMKHWGEYGRYGKGGRRAIVVARGAILLNDSREAMLFADKNNCLGDYARMRGTDEHSLRDTQLAGFGLDVNGKKTYDLGGNTIDVTLGKDLTLSLHDNGTDKIVKSIPKRGADPEKVEIARADYSDMKKNIKAVVKNRIELFKDDFVTGSSRTASNWKMSYIKNPLLHKLAQLMVWQYAEGEKVKYFTLSTNGAITSDGSAFELGDTGKISIAHPVEMTAGEIDAWQNYFVTNSLKQPFEQIWEPVVNVTGADVAQRYQDTEVPMFSLRGLTKNGFKLVEAGDGEGAVSRSYGRLTIPFRRAYRDRYNYWQQIGATETVVLGSGSCSLRSKRELNHAVVLLDKITVFTRIAADDAVISQYLANFSAAQIDKFLKYAIKKERVNCTALLLDYKDRHFSRFAKMDEFTLD